MIEDVFGLYRILEVPTDASLTQIKKSYRSLALRYHPDKNHHDPEAEIKFKAIAAAYNVLSDETQRETYNRLKTNENNEVVLDCPPSDITSDTVFWVGIILGHLISAGAYSILPFPALLTYFLAPTIGSLAVTTLENICANGTRENQQQQQQQQLQYTNAMKIGVGMFVSPVVPIALTADFTLSLINTVKNFICNLSVTKEYSTLSLQQRLKIEEDLENDWVLATPTDSVTESSNWGCHSPQNNRHKSGKMVGLSRCNSGLCEEDDFVIV